MADTYERKTFGDATFRLSSGRTRTQGTGGTRYLYRVAIQIGLGIQMASTTDFIDSVLGSEDFGWIRDGGVRFKRVDTDAETNTWILIAAPGVVDILCYPLQTNGEVSCRNGNFVVLNSERWKTGVPHYIGDGKPGLRRYRVMLVNHEVGHRIGQKHRHCPGSGKPAPVMQQQTYGLQGCMPNWWPLDSEVASLMPSGSVALMSVPEEASLE